jgi:hypothetical protein
MFIGGATILTLGCFGLVSDAGFIILSVVIMAIVPPLMCVEIMMTQHQLAGGLVVAPERM